MDRRTCWRSCAGAGCTIYELAAGEPRLHVAANPPCAGGCGELAFGRA